MPLRALMTMASPAHMILMIVAIAISAAITRAWMGRRGGRLSVRQLFARMVVVVRRLGGTPARHSGRGNGRCFPSLLRPA
jgi:hypothetical protein